MKKIAFLLCLLMFPIFVCAKDIYLEELTILNGELSIPFDALNNEYTITLPKDEYSLEIDYKTKEECNVSIIDNYDLQNNSTVTILLNDEKNKTEYHLHILKEEEEKTQTTFNEDTIEIPNSFMYTYKIYIIPSVCFLLIGITYKCLFYKKKKHK